MAKRKIIYGTQCVSDFTEKEKTQVVETIKELMFGSIKKLTEIIFFFSIMLLSGCVEDENTKEAQHHYKEGYRFYVCSDSLVIQPLGSHCIYVKEIDRLSQGACALLVNENITLCGNFMYKTLQGEK
jgi:hypothetical protein